MRALPAELDGRPFTRGQALEAGITDRMLRGRRFVRVFHGVYRLAQTEVTQTFLIRAATLILPSDAAVSHLTCLRLYGYEHGPQLPLHFSTNSATRTPSARIVLHRRRSDLHATTRNGFVCLGPMRTFIDVATLVNDRGLLRIGDWMVAEDLIELARLRAYVADSHLDGVQRARRVVPRIRAGVASPRESDVRWSLWRAGLPEPDINDDIHDDHGVWLARGDLVFRRWKVLVEYDGWQHERNANQRQWDHLRREALEAAGWRLIIVTAQDMANPSSIAVRVRQALRQRGYQG